MKPFRCGWLVCGAMLLVLGASAPLQAQIRSVTGVVTDKAGNALKGAAVQIENPRTLSIASYITRDNGRYYFHQLSPDLDYTLTARYKKWWSKGKTLSKFDSKTEAVINLEIPVD